MHASATFLSIRQVVTSAVLLLVVLSSVHARGVSAANPPDVPPGVQFQAARVNRIARFGFPLLLGLILVYSFRV